MLPGNTFATRYRLQKKAGVRAYAEVWQALEETADDALVALKIFAPERGVDDVTLKLFYREYAELLSLSHPHLLSARHFDVWQGYPYLVMSWCHGGSLYQRLLESGPLSEAEIARLLMQAGSALEYLHERNILHRDIKPDNVLIDKQGSFLLADFGVSAKLRNVLRKSSANDKVLSMAYAPPERFGSVQESRREGDIFALGVTLYEACTGEPPWMGAGGIVLKENSPLPELPASYSRALQSLVQHCLQYDPSARPSAANVRSAGMYFVQHGQWPAPYFQKDELPVKTARATLPVSIVEVAEDTPFPEVEEIEEPGETGIAEHPLPTEDQEEVFVAQEFPETTAEVAEEPEMPFVETAEMEIEEVAEEVAPVVESLEPETINEAVEGEDVALSGATDMEAMPDEVVAPEIEEDDEEAASVPIHAVAAQEVAPVKPVGSRKNALITVSVLMGFIVVVAAIYVGINSNQKEVPATPDNTMARYNALMEDARTAMASGQFEEALRFAKQAREWCSDCSGASLVIAQVADSIQSRFDMWIHSGDAHLAAGRWEDAERAYTEAGNLLPEQDLPREKLSLLEQKKMPRAAVITEGNLVSWISPSGEAGDYTGQLLNGVPHGRGSIRMYSGNTYTGTFSHGKMNGDGKYTLVDGTTYNGQFLNGKYHGQGVLTFPNGETYIGSFRNGVMSGTGTVVPAP